jgi:hypothetical protein
LKQVAAIHERLVHRCRKLPAKFPLAQRTNHMSTFGSCMTHTSALG